MNEKHCVSLSLARRIKEAGWKKETEFCWIQDALGQWKLVNIHYLDSDDCSLGEFNSKISAPLATEILEELPSEIENYAELSISKDSNNFYYVQYQGVDNETCGEFFRDKSLSNALALMWLYLRKEGLI